MSKFLAIALLIPFLCRSQVVEMPIVAYRVPSSGANTPAGVSPIYWGEADKKATNTSNVSPPANGDVLKGLGDLGLNGFHAIAETGTKPIFHNTGGGPSGTNEYIAFDTTAALTNRCGTSLYAQPNSITFVWNWQPGGGAYWNTWSNQNTQINLASGSIHMFAQGADQTVYTPNSSIWVIDTFVFNGASSLWRHNGTNGPALAGNPGTANCPGYTIGNFFNYSSGGPMNLYGIVWAPTSDTSAIHTYVETYFANKLGIQNYNP